MDVPLLCRAPPAPSPSCLSERLESFEGGNTGRRAMRPRHPRGRPSVQLPARSSGSGVYRDFIGECKVAAAFSIGAAPTVLPANRDLAWKLRSLLDSAWFPVSLRRVLREEV